VVSRGTFPRHTSDGVAHQHLTKNILDGSTFSPQ
jgi:hypothetical protein